MQPTRFTNLFASIEQVSELQPNWTVVVFSCSSSKWNWTHEMLFECWINNIACQMWMKFTVLRVRCKTKAKNSLESFGPKQYYTNQKYTIRIGVLLLCILGFILKLNSSLLGIASNCKIKLQFFMSFTWQHFHYNVLFLCIFPSFSI